MRISFKANCQFLNNTLEVIAETNQGYINSKIPIRVKAHCMEQISIVQGGAEDTLNRFTNFRGTNIALRNTADAAVLLVEEFGDQYCGMGWIGAIGYRGGQTLSTVKKACALGSFTIGHEVGHNFGCQHNKEIQPWQANVAF